MNTPGFEPSTLNNLTRLACLVCAATIGIHAPAQTPPDSTSPRPTDATDRPARRSSNTNDPIARIRDEGLNRSQVMDTMTYLTDLIGPRLTGSPNMKHANEWTRDKLAEWGLTNANLEAWGPFGYGWSLQRFSAQIIEPHAIPIKAYPNAWSPGFDRPVEADVIFLDATNTTQLEKYKGKLKGAVVLASPVRPVPARWEPLTRRLEATNLLALANADAPTPARPSETPFPIRGGIGFGERRDDTNSVNGTRSSITNATGSGGNARTPPRRRRGANWTRFLPFLNDEGVAAVLTPSTIGDAGTIFVTSASVPQTEGETNSAPGDFPRPNTARRPSAYSTNAPTIPPQITVAVEDYNRLVRMTQAGEKLKAAMDLQVQFHTNDVMAYNTVAEIPGSDLKDEVVMVGGHLDSWHSGTGATDNGAGVAVAMEAARIIKALNLQPRRTIRVALWSGEEQGLLGSRAYVSKHFGRFETNTTETVALRSPRDAGADDRPARSNRSRPNRKLVKEAGYDKLSVYLNLDNGAGKIRGIYLQGNEALRPYFRKWLEPLRDLGAETLTPSNTGSTDHIPFDSIGLPGLQFIQDPLDYGTRTHHSNEDVFDRIQPDDLKQAAVVMATCAYQAAMLDEKLPRKPVAE
ncbi:MAG TPA: M20/M25/M40 family metallo-hydrolase [Verrucomicrobiae bacterium]|nr:M20/M25/M40 family metallo-hydrolase [Verrucomicrobiae bacterium]